jgi:glycosyltransferase involved in cell wall biosynthesis
MNTPVLLLAYNRPEQTGRVLQRLRECGVTNIFVSADGPKSKTDRVKTDEVKSCINRHSSIISHSQSSEHNLGCKKAVITGVNWFFDNVEEGIILEDDCLPNEHFFAFSNDLLSRYREERNIWMISGNNPLGSWEAQGNHFFSRIGHIWGWATWKDRWDDFRPELPYIQSFIDNQGFEKAFGPTRLAQSRKELTLKAKSGEIDTWDYQWMAQILTENGLAVVPSQNLVQNIGFESTGTNLTKKPNWIQNETASNPITISERSIEIDREYEMELMLCKRSDSTANKSVFHYSESGKSSSQKLKIVLINSTDVGGGAEKITLSIHLELLKQGHDSTLLVQHKKSNLDSVEEFVLDPLEHIRKLKPDVVHIHNLHGTALKLNEVAKLSQEIPIVFTLHDSWLTTGSDSHPFVINRTELSFLEMMEWKKELDQRNLSIGQSEIQFTTPSHWLKELLFQTHGIKVQFVPNAIEKANPTTIKLPSERYILFVANNGDKNPYKDFETLKSAWIKANPELKNSSVDLVCVSGSAKEEQFGQGRLIVLSKRNTSEILGLMENALFVVQASKQDNSPLTILEAHSVNKPVVASLVGGIPELLSDKELEFAYQSDHPQQLQQKLVDAVRSSDNGSFTFRASKLESFSKMVDAYLGLYLEMANA